MDTNTKPFGSAHQTLDLEDDLHSQFGAEFSDFDAEQILVALHKAVQD